MKRFPTLLLVLVGYACFFLFTFPLPFRFLFFCFGLGVGYCFHLIDRFFQMMFISEFEQYRQPFFSFVKKVNFYAAVTVLIKNIQAQSNTFYFILLYFPLAFYVISSTGSVVGAGLVLGLGLSYSIHFILGHKQMAAMRELYFKPLHHSVKDKDLKKVMGGFVIGFIVLSLFVLA